MAPVNGGKENGYMKKKTVINSKKQYSKMKKNKSSEPKIVKERHIIYRSDKQRVKAPLYTNEQIGKIEIVKDFLPSPDELALKDPTVKVTLNLSKYSVDFFKALAEKSGSQYQKVIRNLLDRYAQNFTGQI